MYLMMFLKRRRRRGRGRLDETTSAPERNTPNFEFPTIAIRSLQRIEADLSTAIHESSNNNTEQLQTNRQHQQLSMQQMPLLYSLARSWAWSAVAHRCVTHPHEASADFVDHRGDNVLHWTVFGRPGAQVVAALLNACPELAQRPNNQGLYPLHVACSYRASADVIRFLVEAYPEAAGKPTKTGAYALHFMCDYGTTPEALRAILQTPNAIPSVSRRDPIYQRRPLHIWNGRKSLGTCQRLRDGLRKLRRRIRQQQAVHCNRYRRHHHDDIDATNEKNTHQHQLNRIAQETSIYFESQENVHLADFASHDLWICAAMLLVVEATQKPLPTLPKEQEESTDASTTTITICTTTNDNTVPLIPNVKVLHAALQIADCPSSFQEWAILLYADHLLTPLADGRLALHVAAARRQTGLLLDLLQACPEAAAVRDCHGALPLQTALYGIDGGNGDDNDGDGGGGNYNDNHHHHHHNEAWQWKDGIGALIEAYPAALEELPSLDFPLYPYIWSRLSTREALFRAVRGGTHLLGGTR